MSKNDRAIRLFERGSQALNALHGYNGIYICPICERKFKRSDLDSRELTLEHAPPESIGGKEILLTCRKCNNFSGHTFDAQISRRAKAEDFLDFFTRQPNNSKHRSVLTMGESRVNTEISHSHDTYIIKIIDKLNSPDKINRLENQIESLTESGNSAGAIINLQHHHNFSFNARHAQISDLRSAFLVCTARFGYSFALSPALKDVREQIRNPDKSVLSQWMVNVPSMEDAKIFLCENNGVVITKYKGTSVVLPWLQQSGKGIKNLIEVQSFQLTGTQFSWPTWFHACYDLR